MRNFIVIVALFIATPAICQEGNMFPEMDAETLTNKFVNLPNDFNGKYSLISLAYSKKSESDLGTWFQPIYNHFIYKSSADNLFAGNYDINVFFIPMFTGAKRPAYKKAMTKIKKTVDKKIQPHLLFYKGTMKQYKTALGFEGRDVPYFYVIDPEGKIVYATSGRHTDKKMREIVDAVEASYE